MAAKSKTVFVCQNCGSERPKWEGQCRDCGAWNSLIEEKVVAAPKNSRAWSVGSEGSPSQTVLSLDSDVAVSETQRWNTGMNELNRVLGGGLVAGSYNLLGGDPGIGKSTLLMQMAGRLGAVQRKVLYVSGEESVEQTALRAQRLGVKTAAVQVAAESRLHQILNLVENIKPEVLIIDSIQTIYLDDIPSAPGTVSQVRECAARLMAVAKTSKVAVFLVGHITKDGHIAGPKTLEHMVDTVLSFEGDANYQFRLLRAQKNRFGPTNELGVFQMSGNGLEEVSNPSELFLAERGESLVGSTVFAAVEGTRPMLCEVQSLSSPSYMAMPRRTSLGFDVNRVHLLTAVLDKHLDCDFARHDVFVNVVGGLKIAEPAADLAIASAMISSVSNSTLPAQTVFFGEIGLTGEVRAATMAVERLRESEKLGFTQAVLPLGNKKHVEKELKNSKIRLHYIKHISELSKFQGRTTTATPQKPTTGVRTVTPRVELFED
jgi:DNA repair protein RadA/Sms